LRVPGFRLLKALSVGAKRVRPWKELLSWLVIWSPTWVDFRRRIRVVYCPPFSRIAVRLSGAGVGPGATAGASLASAAAARTRRSVVRMAAAMVN